MSIFNINNDCETILSDASIGQWDQISILRIIETKLWNVLVIGNEVKFQY